MKQVLRLTESQLRNVISESVKRVINEGIYGYPDGIDHLIFLAENDRELYEIYIAIAKMVLKKKNRGIELSVDVLANSSVMKKYQQMVFRKYKHEQPMFERNAAGAFRRYISEKMIDDINWGAFDWILSK